MQSWIIWRVARGNRPIKPHVKLGKVEAENAAGAIGRFLAIQNHYRDAVELAASPAQKAA